MTDKVQSTLLPLLMAAVMLVQGCGVFSNLQRRTYSPSTFIEAADSPKSRIEKASPYIKLHMKSGELFVLDTWSLDKPRRIMDGQGLQYSMKRDTLGAGPFSIGLDSVSIIETNELSFSGTEATLTIFLGVTGAIAAYCITNPKACFGSCPTFYLTDVDSLRPRAEGFSSSIAPSLEATDCDALGEVPLSSTHVTVEMRNEALETHIVRKVELLAVAKTPGAAIYKDDRGMFRECYDPRPPVCASAAEGDCRAVLSAADGLERMSRADSTNLASKETIELEFDRVPGDSCGIVIGCRQSLMTTFLFYKTLGYMGKNAGEWFAEMERGGAIEPMKALEELLGGIDVLVNNASGEWTRVGSVLEYGPLATDVHLLPLPVSAASPVRVRLVMTKGYWRIDNVALVRMGRTVEPLHISPALVLRDGIRDELARMLLTDPAKTLVTRPGDTYSMRFELPERADRYGLFLETRGYYLEWIRQSWMDEENPTALGEMLFDPARALRRLAPEFARSERAIEEQFWRSKYAR